MTDETPVEPARVLAALEVLGWPDDRDRSAHVEPDGYEVTPTRHYWETVEDVIRAADAATPPQDPRTTPDGNRPDSCGHCELLPTVNGAIVRAVRSSCPTHAGITSTRPPS